MDGQSTIHEDGNLEENEGLVGKTNGFRSGLDNEVETLRDYVDI